MLYPHSARFSYIFYLTTVVRLFYSFSWQVRLSNVFIKRFVRLTWLLSILPLGRWFLSMTGINSILEYTMCNIITHKLYCKLCDDCIALMEGLFIYLGNECSCTSFFNFNSAECFVIKLWLIVGDSIYFLGLLSFLHYKIMAWIPIVRNNQRA